MDGRGGGWLQAVCLQPREGAGSRQLAQPLMEAEMHTLSLFSD